MNKRGEVITITVVAVCILSAIVGLFMAQVPAVKGVLGFKDQKIVQTSTTEPVWLTGPKGEKYLATRETVMDTTQQVKQPLVDRLKGWLLVLGILCFLFPGIGVWLWARAKGAYNDLQTETKKIIASVQAARAVAKAQPDPTLIQKMNDAMDKVQDQSTKDLVTKLKQ